MAAPSSSLVPQATSTTSSGFADGLGRRELAFDREEGVMLERLSLKPELGAFESVLRDRIERLSGLEDERLARPRMIAREPNGGLVVVSEFVPGSRLSDLLETSAELGHVPGVDAALGFLLDVLPALCGLHAGVGFSHGTMTPSRIVLTPAGQVVLLDGIYGSALSHLRFGRRKLWVEFGLATAPSAGTPRLDAGADIAQAALAAVMLVVGRPVRADEYLSGLRGVLREVVEVAQIRSTTAFADGLQEFLERALSGAPHAPYDSADDALIDVRQLANELGAQVCRRALVDFIEQMESPSTAAAAAEYDDIAGEIEGYGLEDSSHAAQIIEDPAQDLTTGVDAELDLDSLVEDATYEIASEEPIEISPPAPASTAAAPAAIIDDEAVDWVQLAAASEAQDTERLASPAEPQAVAETETPAPEPAAIEPPVALAATGPEPTAASDRVIEAPLAEAVEPAEAAAADAEDVDAEREDAEPEPETKRVLGLRWRRAKRATRSVRARKDKLRSASEPEPPAVVPAEPTPPPAPEPAPAPAPAPEPKKPASGGWLVAPDRAAAFEPAVPVTTAFEPPPPQTTPAPPPPTFAAPGPQFTPPPPVPLYTPPPASASLYSPPAAAGDHPPDPFFTPPAAPEPSPDPFFSRTVGSIAPSYSAPPQPIAPSYPAPPQWTPPVTASSTPQLVTAKLKDPEPRPRSQRSPDASDIYGSAPAPVQTSEPTPFPWKLAAVAAGIMVIAIIGGHVYMPAKGTKTEETKAAAPAPTTAPPAQAAPPIAIANTGRLEIDTQPAGARILLDGKPSGESPVALDGIAAGRHTVTFVSASGSVKRTIRVEAGRTTKLDVPIFSGWVGIYAPFIVEVSEGGKVIGTTEEPRIMLSPGRHDLTLVNRELGYNSQQTVEVEPGEVKSVSIDPRGIVNLNASPWAEVWIDGRKAGDTPLANLQLPLGVREITFRHPEHGERKVTVTVKGNAPVLVSIDMTKPKS